MTIEQINKLTVDDVLIELLRRLVDFEVPLPDGEFPYWFTDLNNKTYDNLILHERFIKPSLKEFEDELVIYKAELIAEETERLRKESLHARWNTIAQRDAGYPAFYRIVKNQPNASWFMNSLIEDKTLAVMAENILSQIEITDVAIIKENNDRKKRDDLIAIGRKEKEQCENVQYLLAGYLSKVTLTKPQETALANDLKVTKEKIASSKPKEVKAEIEKLTVNEVITAEIKEALLKELNQ